MKIGDTQKLIESGLGENDSNIRYYRKTEELFHILETALVNIGHKRTRSKRHCFVCDLQKKKKNFFISSFLKFCFFLPVMEAELKKQFCNSEVCHRRCVLKTNGKVNSVRKNK